MAKFNLKHLLIIAVITMLGGAPVMAQLSVPQVGVPGTDGATNGLLRPVTDAVSDLERDTREQVERLAKQRLRTIRRLVRRNRDTVDIDRNGAPARRGELLVMAASETGLASADRAGFALLGQEEIEGLDFSVARLSVPESMSLAEAEAALAAILPNADISADHLHFTQGIRSVAAQAGGGNRGLGSISVPIGVIDGAPGPAIPVAGTRGFAKGAPVASHHGSAIASLLRAMGARTVYVADVYGTDPAGGNALAIARGIGWLMSKKSRVITISLVGPRNAVVQRAISAAQRKGTIVVAAVGNDGPAAPAAYPASYRGVVAVTGVDRRNRALIEAGRALHLDYAAPGADVYAFNAKGKRMKLRGTSFATPLVAARIAAAMSRGTDWRNSLNSEAIDLGKRGPDKIFGNGLLCGACARR